MDSLDFMRVAAGGAGKGDGTARGGTETVDFYTSHEGLSLEYEEALTRGVKALPHGGGGFSSFARPARPAAGSSSRASSKVRNTPETQTQQPEEGEKFYNLSSHFIWIGDRTRQLDGAHVEYFRGIQNPIGIKVGPTMKGDELVKMLDSTSNPLSKMNDTLTALRSQLSTLTTSQARSLLSVDTARIK